MNMPNPRLALTILIFTTSAAHAANGKGVADQITSAKAGQTVQLPAGTFDIGDVSVPSGVRVVGAGYKQTILNAAGFGDGLVVKDGKDISLSDLTIRGARASALSVRKASNLHVERVRLLDSAAGLL